MICLCKWDIFRVNMDRDGHRIQDKEKQVDCACEEEEISGSIDQNFSTVTKSTPEWTWLFREHQKQEHRMKKLEEFNDRYEDYCRRHHIENKRTQVSLPECYFKRFAGIKTFISNTPIELKNSHTTRRLLQQQYNESIVNKSLLESDASRNNYENETKGNKLFCSSCLFNRKVSKNKQ